MINIGIIGCGKIAQVRHIPEYAENPDVKLAAFFSPNRARAQEQADKYGGKVYDTAEALLADPDIDAVSICAANYAHAELSMQALNAGKHVLCEKPMATTLADCEAMVECAKKNGKFLMIGHNQRLAKAHMEAKRLIDEGLIGDIITFRTSFGHGGPETWSISPGKNVWFFDKKKAAMGVMADLGVHKTDLIQYLTGQRVVRTTARLVTLDKRGVDGELIGDIITFRTSFGHGGPETWAIKPGKDTWFFDKSKAAMGVMADLGVHKTDLIQYLTGQRVVRTTARLVTLDKRGEDGELIGVDDNAVCIYEMSGGAFGTMTASWTYYGAEDNSTVLYGTKGIMRIYDDPAHSIVVKLADGQEQVYDVEQIQTNDNQTKSGVIDQWVDCLKEGRQPEISGASVLSAMRAVFASIQSAETGSTVEIEENK